MIKAGDVDKAIYLILSGKIRIVKGIDRQSKGTVFLHKGDWIVGFGLVRKIQRIASVVAAEPSSIMAVNRKTLDALEKNTTVFL